MTRRTLRWLMVVIIFMTAVAGARLLTAQDATPTPDPACEPAALKQQQEAFAQVMSFDFENSPTLSLENLYKLGAYYQQLAVKCGYKLTEEDISHQIDLTLSITTLDKVMAARAVGMDVAEAMAKIEPLTGDPVMGQILYNGLDIVLDGTTLGCLTCHQGVTAPLVEGTYTRVVEIRLKEPQFAGYTARQYLVESILKPEAYIVPDFNPGLMPVQFGTRLDEQMLADIVAFLESQDQPLPEGQ